MISCAAIQKLERYGYLGLKRHSTEDFVTTSIKDAKRTNVYALTLLETWKEAVQAVRGHRSRSGNDDARDVSTLVLNEGTAMEAPARFTDALVYAMSFAVAFITQHVLEVTVVEKNNSDAEHQEHEPSSRLFPDLYVAALELLTMLKDMGLGISSGPALRSNASSYDFTKAVAHLLTNVLDLMLLLAASHPDSTESASSSDPKKQKSSVFFREQMLAQGSVLTASVAQMLRRVQANYPVADLYNTKPCAALLKQVSNKHKQQQKNNNSSKSSIPIPASKSKSEAISLVAAASAQQQRQQIQEPLLDLLRRYVDVCTHSAATGSSFVSAANLFSVFSLFQRISMLHGAFAAVNVCHRNFPDVLRCASAEVQHWLSQLLSSTACNRATRYVVYFREDEMRLMQHNIRQASEYGLYTFTTTPPVDPGLVESLLGTESASESTQNNQSNTWMSTVHSSGGNADAVTRARAALILAQWCVSAPFFFESFCQDGSWASFAQEQRRLVLLQQSRARRGLEKMSKSKKESRSSSNTSERDDGGNATSGTRSSSASSRSSDADTASLMSFQTASRASRDSVGGSLTSLASRVSLLSTFSKHSAASYVSFLSVLRPSTAARSVAGGTVRSGGDGNANDDCGLLDAGERQLHESEDGNTNLPLILLEQLTLGLHQFMETYPVKLLDAYGLRSISWNCVARMFAFVEESLNSTSLSSLGKRTKRLAATKAIINSAAGLPQPLFNLAQDIRYNKGMGYECLGLLFAKAVAPLLDVSLSAQTQETNQQDTPKRRSAAESSGSDDSAEKSEEDYRKGKLNEEKDQENGDAIRRVGGVRTEENCSTIATALASTAVGRANLLANDDAATRRHVEAALSTCLTAYETVAPQVVDMNLTTILRLAARTAASSSSDSVNIASTKQTEEQKSMPSSPCSKLLISFLQDITRRLGSSNELPHLVDALLGRGDAEATARKQHDSAPRASDAEELGNLKALRCVFRLPRVRSALTDAAGMSLDPESLLLHLTNIAAELEENVGVIEHKHASENTDDGYGSSQAPSTAAAAAATMHRTLLTLEVMEAVLEGVAPTSVSASAVLEQTTQLELLLTSSFMKCVEFVHDTSAIFKLQPRITRWAVVQHACTIRQCRAVTALCLQDLGTQQVQEYLVVLDKTLWQLSTDIGQLIGTLSIAELQPLLKVGSNDEKNNDEMEPTLMLLPSLVLQRLSLARAVTAALGTTAGPAQQLHDMVAYIWQCIKGSTGSDDDDCSKEIVGSGSRRVEFHELDYLSLLLANQLNSEDWVSVVTLGKEKHARVAMMALLLRSSTFASSAISSSAVSAVSERVDSAAPLLLLDTPWLSCCLSCIPGTALRALVDVYVTLSMEELCDNVVPTAFSSFTLHSTASASALRWMALLTALVGAYAVVGHNPYWPSVLLHTVRAITHLTRVWRKVSRTISSNDQTSPNTKSANAISAGALLFSQLSEKLLELVLCVVRSEARAPEVMRKAFLASLQESLMPELAATQTLSRSGMSVAYVKSIRVPANTLSDLAAPPALTAVTTQNDSYNEELSVLKGLSFEDELRDLCSLLFQPNFVKHIFSLIDLAEAATTSGITSAIPGLCMRTLGFLYQVSLATARVAWRSRMTNGSYEALRNTQAVTYLHNVAQAFHKRTLTVVDEHDAAALMAFLESFDAADDHYLFVHIGSQKTKDAAATNEDTQHSGALDAVQHYWTCVFCHCASSVMIDEKKVKAHTTAGSNTTAEISKCDVFRLLFARLLASAQHTQHQTSKSGFSNYSAGGAGKRARHGGGNGSESTKHERAEPTTTAVAEVKKEKDGGLAAALGVTVGSVTEFLRELLSGSPVHSHSASEDDAAKEHNEHALKLRDQLSTFFCASTNPTTGNEASESTICAWWLLWKLFTVSVITSATKTEDVLQIHSQVRASLAARVTTLSTEEEAVTLRGCSFVLDVLPADAAPPLLFDHLNNVLLRVIPESNDESAHMEASMNAVAAAAELLHQLFRVRPRLPAWRTLPHVQRLLVWLTHTKTRSSNGRSSRNGPSLPSLGIRLCAAVAAHPLVVSDSAASVSSTENMLESPFWPHCSVALTKQHNKISRPLIPGATELLDNVWLLLLSLLQGSTQGPSSTCFIPSAAATTSKQGANQTFELQESEILHVITLLTRTWLRSRQQQLWSRPAMLPPVMCALFSCVMRGVAAARYSPRVLNVLARGLAAMAAHVDAATAAEANDDDDADSNTDSADNETKDADSKDNGSGTDENAGTKKAQKKVGSTKGDEDKVACPLRKRYKTETNNKSKRGISASAAAVPVFVASAYLQRMVLAATTASLFEVAQHYVHVFMSFSSDMDFLFTDFLRVLSQHFLPTVKRPPIAYHAGVRITGTTRSEMTFADLAYMCVGNAESKSLLKQAAQRMEEEDGGAAGSLGLTDGSRSIFHVA